MKKIISPKKINLANSKSINEKIIQDIIAEDPSIIGLGDLILKDKERIQPKAGRLDLLFQDSETKRRYEVELQLGKTDETHIIRTIEYWDIERKRYPQYDHCAVIIAEDITSRFLNVISLFNGHIPLIAIQMTAFELDGNIGLLFTKVLDELPLGLIDEDEEIKEVTDRNYWLKRGTPETVEMADKMLDLLNTFTEGYELKYNKFYIGLSKGGQANNIVIFKPLKKNMNIEIRHPRSEDIDNIIEREELDDMGYDSQWGVYRIRLSKGEIKSKKDVLKDLMQRAEVFRNS